MKKVLFLLIALVMALMVILVYLFVVNNNEKKSYSLLEHEVSKLVSEKEDLINNLEISKKQNDELVESNKSKDSELIENRKNQKEFSESEESNNEKINELEQIVDNLRSELNKYTEIVLKLEEMTMTYTFQKDDKNLEINDTEDSIESILGKGIEIENWADKGDGFWYLKGALYKKIMYGNIEITYLKYEGKEEYIATAIITSDDTVKLSNGLMVGQSNDELLQFYPSFIRCNPNKDDTYRYMYQGMDKMNSIDINVVNGKIVSITTARIFD